MTEKKQITIYELLPALFKGYVCYDKYGWFYYDEEPEFTGEIWTSPSYGVWLSRIFNIQKFNGDWKDSLMEVK